MNLRGRSGLRGSTSPVLEMENRKPWKPPSGFVSGGIPTPTEKYDFVSWDDEIPNIWKFNLKKHVPKHQPDMLVFFADPDYY